jgi:hypothetical protein
MNSDPTKSFSGKEKKRKRNVARSLRPKITLPNKTDEPARASLPSCTRKAAIHLRSHYAKILGNISLSHHSPVYLQNEHSLKSICEKAYCCLVEKIRKLG